ncbi:hypothetical protein FQN53_005918 [Emmonsiellopsis sp. PD_33]|nr:hypothetical protein FQN53_005918 [Emmonsiellopsis sp. PD_33]
MDSHNDPHHHHHHHDHPTAATDPNNLPTGAQIPLQSFQLPPFPTEASHLQALTITSDIKLPDYSNLLTATLPADAIIPPSLPSGIESLTLELFSLGYPAPFLSELGRKLPRLKSLTVYSQLIDGVSDESRKDAGGFFNEILVGGGGGDGGNGNDDGGLRELHLLDTFSRKGFISGLGAILESQHREDPQKGKLRFLEISYTYRGHSDAGFLARIPGDEFPTMLVPSLMAVSFSLNSPPADSQQGGDGGGDLPLDPADVDEEGKPIPGKKPEGIVPLSNGNGGVEVLVRKLCGEGLTVECSENGKEREEFFPPGSGPGPTGLKMLDATLYTIDAGQLGKIMKVQKELGVLSVSVLVGPTGEWKEKLIHALHGGVDGNGAAELEIVEVIGVPDDQFDKEVSTSASLESDTTSSILEKVFPSATDMALLSKHAPKLESFRMSILRAASFGHVEWNRSIPGAVSGSGGTIVTDGGWVGGISKAG